MKKRLLSLAIPAIFLVVFVFAGCSGSDDSAEGPSGPFEQMLAHIPDIPDSRQSFAVIDVAAARAELGIDVLADDAGPEQLLEYQMALMIGFQKEISTKLSVSDTWLSGFNNYIDIVESTMYDSLGFDSRNVDQVASFGGHDPIYREVLLGSYSPSVTSERLLDCDECEPHDIVTRLGIEYYAWGDDFKSNLDGRFLPPAYDYLGRGGRILVQEGMASRTLSNEHMEQIIDASTDKSASLADDSSYVLAARILAEHDVVAARFFGASFSVEDSLTQMQEFWDSGLSKAITIEEIEEQFSNAHLVQPYEVAAVGVAFPESEGASPNNYAVLVYSSEADAEKNAEQLKLRIEEDEYLLLSALRQYEQPSVDQPATWAEYFTEYEVTTDGNAVVLRVTAENSGDNLSRALLWQPATPLSTHSLLVSQ